MLFNFKYLYECLFLSKNKLVKTVSQSDNFDSRAAFMFYFITNLPFLKYADLNICAARVHAERVNFVFLGTNELIVSLVMFK